MHTVTCVLDCCIDGKLESKEVIHAVVIAKNRSKNHAKTVTLRVFILEEIGSIGIRPRFA